MHNAISVMWVGVVTGMEKAADTHEWSLGEEEGTNKKMKEFEEGREWNTAMFLLLPPLSLVWSVRAHPWAAALVLPLLEAAEVLLRQVQSYS